MANFNSSTGALSNLLIGLGRGYWKQRRLIDRRYKDNVRKHRDAVMALEDDFIDHLATMCAGYFRECDIRDIANKIMYGCYYFKEQK